MFQKLKESFDPWNSSNHMGALVLDHADEGLSGGEALDLEHLRNFEDLLCH